jgi:hypothetical protein
MEIHQMDVKSAFLNGVLEEEIFMELPEGLPGSYSSNQCCRLHKSIYGLKQAPRVWNQLLDSFLLKEKFIRLKTENSVYILPFPESPLYLAVWIDDLVLLSKNSDLLNSVKKILSSKFKMTDQGEISYLLGISFNRDRSLGKMWLNQKHYLLKVLSKFSMNDCNGVSTPMELNKDIFTSVKNSNELEEIDMKRFPYRQLIGSLMYAMLGTRPDLSFVISVLSRFLHVPTKKHWDAAKRVLRYVKSTLEYNIVYVASGNREIVGYSDSEWAGDLISRKSTSGYVFILCGGAVTWKSRKQNSVATSTTEAEFYAVSLATSEAIWLKNFIWELSLPRPQVPRPIQIFSDNQGCVFFAKDPTDHGRLKHISIRHMFVRDAIHKKYVEVVHYRTHLMAADVMTKPLSRDKLLRCLTIFGLMDIAG